VESLHCKFTAKCAICSKQMLKIGQYDGNLVALVADFLDYCLYRTPIGSHASSME